MVDTCSKAVELVLFVGPPFSGKTLYYVYNLQSTHERVCPQQIYADNRKNVRSLAQLIVYVLDILRRGRSVVVDDLNWSSGLRSSYFSKVRAKLPSCQCRCLVFRPRFSLRQCLWSWYWSTAPHVDGGRSLSHHDVTPDLVDIYLNLWFSDEQQAQQRQHRGASRRHVLRQTAIAPPDIPSVTTSDITGDGVQTGTVTSLLSCESEFEWNTPALFIEHTAVGRPSTTENGVHLVDDVVEACRLWADKQPLGRLILLCDDVDDGNVQSQREHLSQLAESMAQRLPSHPVYFLLVAAGATGGTFPGTALPPQPGLVAWLQCTHMLSVTHTHTFYIWTTAEHRIAAETCGLFTFKAERLASKPHSIVAVKFSRPQTPQVLLSMRLIHPVSAHALDSSSGGSGSGSGSAGSSRVKSGKTPLTIPLLSEASGVAGAKSAVRRVGKATWHGMAWSSSTALGEYQSRWQDSLVPVQPLAADESAWLVDTGAASKPPTLRRGISLRRQSSFQAAAKPDGGVGTSRAATAHTTALRPATKTPQRLEPGFLPPDSLFVDTQATCTPLTTTTTSTATTAESVLEMSELHTVQAANLNTLAAAAKIYSSGAALRGRVRSLNSNVGNSLMTVSSSVEGSNHESYTVSANVEHHGNVAFFSCTCPFHSRRERTSGCCKHVIGMLLEFNAKQQLKALQQKKQQQQERPSPQHNVSAAKPKREELDAAKSLAPGQQDANKPAVTPAKQSPSDAPQPLSTPHSVGSMTRQETIGGARSLPDWMVGSQLKRQASLSSEQVAKDTTTTSTTAGTAKRNGGGGDFASPIRPKRTMKRTATAAAAAAKPSTTRATDTEYRLSESELLAAAKLIIREHGQARTRVQRAWKQRVQRQRRQQPHRTAAAATTVTFDSSSSCTGEDSSDDCVTVDNAAAPPPPTDNLCVDTLLQELSCEAEVEAQRLDTPLPSDVHVTAETQQVQDIDDHPGHADYEPTANGGRGGGDALDEFFAAIPDLSPVKVAVATDHHTAVTLVPETILAESDGDEQAGDNLVDLFGQQPSSRKRHHSAIDSLQDGSSEDEEKESAEYFAAKNRQPLSRGRLLATKSTASTRSNASTSRLLSRRVDSDLYLHDGRSNSSGIGRQCTKLPQHTHTLRSRQHAPVIIPDSFAILDDDDNSETQLV
eukprot:scpid28481/ scgid34894/ 